MKTKIIIISVALAALFLGGGVFYWHQHKIPPNPPLEKGGHALYHCPMHPSYTSDKPGSCPICGMDLVPVETPPSPPATTPSAGGQPSPQGGEGESDRASVTLSLERQQLIGVKTDVVRKAKAIKEIRTVASVAFNPELSLAQTEYLEAKKMGDASLTAAAHDRLVILGMNDAEIKNLKKAQRGLTLPDKNSWIYPVIYEYELPYVKTGQDVTIDLPGNRTFEGTVKSIDTVIDPMTRSARLHVKIKDAAEGLNPLSFGNARIKIDLGEKLLVPKSAVISTGERNIAFVVYEGTLFMPMDVKLGAELTNDYIVEEGLSEGDTVVTSANFLIDSESKLKAAIGGGGEHRH